MKKTESKFALLAALIAILAFASIPLWQNNLNSLRPQTHTVKKKKTAKKKKVVHVTWGYPFKKLYEKKIKFKRAANSGSFHNFESNFIRRRQACRTWYETPAGRPFRGNNPRCCRCWKSYKCLPWPFWCAPTGPLSGPLPSATNWDISAFLCLW